METQFEIPVATQPAIQLAVVKYAVVGYFDCNRDYCQKFSIIEHPLLVIPQNHGGGSWRSEIPLDFGLNQEDRTYECATWKYLKAHGGPFNCGTVITIERLVVDGKVWWRNKQESEYTACY